MQSMRYHLTSLQRSPLTAVPRVSLPACTVQLGWHRTSVLVAANSGDDVNEGGASDRPAKAPLQGQQQRKQQQGSKRQQQQQGKSKSQRLSQQQGSATSTPAPVSRPRLTWRRSTQPSPPAGSAGSPAPAPGSSTPTPPAAAAVPAASTGDAGTVVSAAGPDTSDEADDDLGLSVEDLYSPAEPAPGFFRPQVSTAAPSEAEAFLVMGMNKPGATPIPAQLIDASTDMAEQQMQAGQADRRKQQTPAYKARLAAAESAATEIFSLLRGQPGSLPDEGLQLADAALKVTSTTSNPLLAELAVEVLQKLAAGVEPDPEDVDALLNPVSMFMEEAGFASPEFDDLALRAFEGRLDDSVDVAGAVSSDLYTFLSECPFWDSMARLFAGVRGRQPELQAVQLPHMLLILRRLPSLVRPSVLGFKARLRFDHFVNSVMKELNNCADELAARPADTAAIALALGHLGTGADLISDTLVDIVDTNLTRFSSRQLADVLWGLGKTQQQVQQDWVDRVWREVVRKGKQGPVYTLCLAKALYASALLQRTPPHHVLPAFYTACKEHIWAFNPQQLSNTLWAVAELELQPPPGWLSELLLMVTYGQDWSTDNTTLNVGLDTGIRQCDARSIAFASAAVAAADSKLPPSVAAAEVASAVAARAGVQAAPHIKAAAAAAAPFLYDWPGDGPLPCSLNSLDFYWIHLLNESRHGSSAASKVFSGLPLVLPTAPAALLVLEPKQLVSMVQALAGLLLAPEEQEISELLEKVLLAAIAAEQYSSKGSKPNSSSSSFAGRSISLLVKDLPIKGQQQQQKQKHKQQGSGFGGRIAKQQPQKRSVADIDPQLVADFDAATGGLWQQAVAKSWTFDQLAAATAYSHTSASAAAEVVAGFLPAWYAASKVWMPHVEPIQLVEMLRAVATLTDNEESTFGPAMLPPGCDANMRGVAEFKESSSLTAEDDDFDEYDDDDEDQLMAADAGAAAVAAAGEQQSPEQCRAEAMQQLGQQQQQLDKGQEEEEEEGQQTAGLQQQGESEQEQEHLPMLQVPPLPPSEWLIAAVERLLVTRAAFSELALWHALEALGQLLQTHTDREQLLQHSSMQDLETQLQQQQQSQQEQQQWWWWQDEDEDEGEHEGEAAEAQAAVSSSQDWLPPPETEAAAAAKAANARRMAALAWDPRAPLNLEAAKAAIRATTAELESAALSWPGNYSSDMSGISKGTQVLQKAGYLSRRGGGGGDDDKEGECGRDFRAGSWMFAPAGNGQPVNSTRSSSSSSSGGGSSSSSVSISVFDKLQVLVGCLGNELGHWVTDVDMLVEEAAAVVSISPDLLHTGWLLHHEACIVASLESEGWDSAAASGGRRGGGGSRSSLRTAVAAGLQPAVCQKLLHVHAAAGYEIVHPGLREVCKQLAGRSASS